MSVEDIEDLRLRFVFSYIQLITDVKYDKIKKFLDDSKQAEKLLDFFEHSDLTHLFVVLHPTGIFEIHTKFPEVFKFKAFYFIKKERGVIEKNTDWHALNALLSYGDMDKSPLHHFIAFVNTVLSPIILNEKNREDWPESLSEYIKRDLYNLQKKSAMVLARIEGKTHLAHPVGIEKIDTQEPISCHGDDVIGSLMYAIETAVVDWSAQINDILKQQSGQAIANGEFPLPNFEYEFWQQRMNCMQDIYEQLVHPKVKKMAVILEANKSAYANPFKEMFKRVVRAIVESETIVTFLTPLINYLNDLETVQFEELKPKIQPIVHLMALLWVNCEYYRSTDRIVILMTETCNLLIQLCRQYLDPTEIIKEEPDEGLIKINKSLDILRHFRDVVEDYRQNVKESCQEQNVEPSEWTFHSSWVFSRLNAFIERLESIRVYYHTLLDYNRLEKVEVHGVVGQTLTTRVSMVYDEYQEAYRKFTDTNMDCLSTEDTTFSTALSEFMKLFDHWDNRMSTIIVKAFLLSNTTLGAFKTIFMFGPLLERTLIKPIFEPCYAELLSKLHLELDTCKEILDSHFDQPERLNQTISKSLPPAAGAIAWSAYLLRRVLSVMGPIDLLDYPLLQTDQGERLLQKRDELLELLSTFRAQRLEEFCKTAPEKCNVNLKLPLLRRNPAMQTIEVNFDDQLVEVLREVHYLLFLSGEDECALTSPESVVFGLPEKIKDSLPASTLDMYKRLEPLRESRLKLAQIQNAYNSVRQKTLTVEFPLIADEVDQFDDLLGPALKTMTWESVDSGFIDTALETVSEIQSRVTKAQENLKQVEHLSGQWRALPLYQGKERKYDCLIPLDEREGLRETRFKEIASAAQKIHELIKENLELYKAEEDGPDWSAYLEAAEDIILEGLIEAVRCSLSYLANHTEKGKVESPLMETKLNLVDNRLSYTPGVLENQAENLLDLVDSLVQDITDQSRLIPSLTNQPQAPPPSASQVAAAAEPEAVDVSDVSVEQTEPSSEVSLSQQVKSLVGFSLQVLNTPEISESIKKITDHVRSAMRSATDFQSNLEASYSVYWAEDRTEFIRQFCRYGRLLTKEDLGPTGEIEAPENPPTLEQFREQILKYDRVYEEVEHLEDSHVFDTWLRADLKPFKMSLLAVIRQWSDKFKQYLVDHVTSTLDNLKAFIEDSINDLELKGDPEKVDYAKLVTVLERLKLIREAEDATDAGFEPLRETVALLKEFGEELPDAMNKLLESLPEQWHELKNIAVLTKQKIQPLQEREVQNIRAMSAHYDTESARLKREFGESEVFTFDCSEPYESLDEWNTRLTEIEEGVAEMQVSAKSFEVRDIPTYLDLKAMRREMKVTKRVWDYINMFRSYVTAWKTSKWKEIDFGAIDEVIREISIEIRTMDKDVKQWPMFQGLEAELKDINAAVTAVRDLQNPAVKERHWVELMTDTGRMIEINDETTLADLLSLNLHKFEEEVHGIVSKASNEQKIERDLEKIEQVWSEMMFEYETHDRTGLELPKQTEELTGTLEEIQVKVLDMLGNRDNTFSIDRINYWHKTLSMTDQVLTLWFETQRVWSGLESIFVLCDDIQAQLPDDTALFMDLDKEFRVLIDELQSKPKVLDATTQRPEILDEIQKIRDGMTICEKALADYLETKRLSFPRFYFVSQVDVTDIVSNGKVPAKVLRHLSKLFDSICSLTFEKPDAAVKHATKMIAKDGEEVKFVKSFDLTGQVEEWLNQLLDEMRHTLRKILADAVAAYEEKPRDQWIFDYPAQIALTGSQIGWNSEVQIAFGRLEEGLENAMKEYNKKQINQLGILIQMLLTDLTPGARQKIMTLCTIDVHNRDIVGKLISQKVDSSQAFTWLSQLRHRWDDARQDCLANICDAQFAYAYEYLGNTPRLVITPLTDRCYITLTQSLHLCMSGAPAGPAGTGKTETTKDLGRALGVMVYVFNCSEQMDYMSVGNIYKGLAQAGAWGCFDEFNRIAVEVLSVVAVQVKAIQDAIRLKKERFNFLGEIIPLDPAVGLFITMNPGYAGRTELPENLKALFRPCAMVVPDFELICEIMLVAQGFLDATILARKFITLYQLCRELLSKQDHYDWGLRAIKSVLVVAGALKRGNPEHSEDSVLMRALRDFNVPKLVTEDMAVFLGLISDLFPNLDAPRKRNMQFEAAVKQATEDLGLQPEDSFILKVVQLQELFDVRHSVFIVGNAGTGKSQVWKTLKQTYRIKKQKPVAVDLDPKAVTNDELFGIINPSTREWKDGLFSVVMRDLANMTGPDPKWIVLDGDIDPMWIESLNTVMDDNKVLTLASNERIPLTDSMRLLFEISHLKTATPATVSRAGILYINPGDLGWIPYVHSWLDERVRAKKTLSRTERPALSICFDKYVGPSLEVVRSKFKRITPIPDIAHVEMLCYLLECMLDAQMASKDTREFTKENYEMLFVFCCVWAFGGSLFKDQLADYRVEFSRWWLNEFKHVKFPSTGGVFDFVWSLQSRKFEPWNSRLTKCELDPEVPLEASLVPTVEVVRLRFFLDLLIEAGHPVMLVGAAGTGKSVIMQDKFASLSEDFMVKNIPFNFYTTSMMLQDVLDKSLEKKAGINYGPPGQKRLIYFIDDLNMPEVDQYFTVQPHTLIRQHIDHGHFYDRQKLTLKRVSKTQYVAAMNPTAGSFTITPRLQRHFSVFALSFPDESAVKTIYSTVLKQHFVRNSFPATLVRSVETLVEACLAAHNKITAVFLPTAVRFHYVFNLRDLTNIFQCLLFSAPETCNSVLSLIRLYRHEAMRVYTDKMLDVADTELAMKHVTNALTSQFPEVLAADITAEPLVYCSFSKGLSGERAYSAVESVEGISEVVINALNTYNDNFAVMNLVLFGDAIAHVLRICRILEMPRGSALLIGIGGSGKQSLSRLAAFISGFEVSQVVLRKGYSQNDLRNHMAQLYLKASLKNMPFVFLMTDAQVADERFLVYVNDFLASGEIPNLFSDEEMEQIIAGIRPEVKSVGLMDSVENCWQFFIDKTRKMLRVILCFSPVGDKLRLRARRFPALVNRTSIDWFHEWPEEALLSVSARFLEDCPGLSEEVLPSVSQYMAFAHSTVNELSRDYLDKERRHNYTTPKSFLEQISLYKRMVGAQIEELQQKIDRLVNGLDRLRDAGEQTSELKVQLAAQEVIVNEKTENANKLIAVVGQETEKVSAEKEIAAEEEAKVSVIKAEVTRKQRDCEEDLRKAEPALIAAQEALNTLNKNNLTELKALTTPPPDVVLVCSAVMCLFAMDGKLPKDRSWRAAKAGMMSKVDQFLSNLLNYDKEHIHHNSKQAAMEYVKMPSFDPDVIRTKSSAAAGLCSWVINILKFYDVYLEVKPKRDALDAANEELRQATEKLEVLQKKISILEASLAELTANFREATEEKLRCQQEADFTAKTLDLANRLVSGFASENVRWAQQVEVLRELGTTVVGDVLITTTFISYFGYLSKPFRQQLMDAKLWPFMRSLAVPIPIRSGIDPLYMLVDDAVIATWNNQSLPEDRMSVENATIFTFCERWPLCVDPQLQALKWIKQKYGSDLIVTRLGVKNYLDQIERAIMDGHTVLIENIGEVVDPILDPVIGRQTIKRGTAIKMGDKEIPYNPNFRLLLQTKLANPHYQPELQAQTTLINFTVTRDGLEDQLLAVVVSKERPDLEKLKSDLTKQQNEFKITLKNLEDSLLAKLASSGGNFLGDHSLVENLETNKKTAKDIEEKVAEAKITEKEINQAREHYRSASSRAALVYFVMNDLCHIHPMYQFSLKAFRTVFEQSIDTAPEADSDKERLISLLDNITYSIFVYTTRGLFEKDKLIFLILMVLQVQLASKELSPVLMDFLLRYPVVPDVKSPVDFLNDLNWGGVQTLVKMSNFRDLDKDIIASAKRWKAFLETEAPEKEKFPQEWKNKSAAEKLCMMRALRHDRMTYALRHYVGTTFGSKYVEARQIEFGRSFKESGPAAPIFFILSPGVDPLKDVEVLGHKLGFTLDQGNFHNISLGQGQEVVAEAALETAAQEGHWVVLQNIHLVARWLSTLEKRLEQYAESAHPDYRVFISAEPAGDPSAHIIPQGILENAIKITNEPPTGMHANLHKALDNFSQETLERCTKEAEFKPILFALCYFHAVVTERSKFGAQGWNRTYPFNVGDLCICLDVLYNYLEANSKVPWEDLRYLFGEIMYGGHITDDWDRRLCRTFLEEFLQPDLV
ncbi:dynein beta chain ciliary, partial [Clonorchis sinensis]